MQMFDFDLGESADEAFGTRRARIGDGVNHGIIHQALQCRRFQGHECAGILERSPDEE